MLFTFFIAAIVTAFVYNNVKKKEMTIMIYKKELKEDELENVDGGYLFHDYSSGKWQVINDRTGSVVENEFINKDAAAKWAEDHGYSSEEISWSRLDTLRKDFDEQNAEWERQFRESQNKK